MIFFDIGAKTSIISSYDEKHSGYGEDRFIAIGMAENRMLFVSFTEPDAETIHIISARKADKQERRYYYGNG